MHVTIYPSLSDSIPLKDKAYSQTPMEGRWVSIDTFFTQVSSYSQEFKGNYIERERERETSNKSKEEKGFSF